MTRINRRHLVGGVLSGGTNIQAPVGFGPMFVTFLDDCVGVRGMYEPPCTCCRLNISWG